MGCLPAYLLACLIWAHVLIVHMCVVQGVYFNPVCLLLPACYCLCVLCRACTSTLTATQIWTTWTTR